VPESEHVIEWNPQTSGVNMEYLERERLRENQDPLPYVRYSLQMDMTSLVTEYQIKAWTFKDGTWTSIRCGQIHETEPLFDQQRISQHLADSFQNEEVKNIESNRLPHIEKSVLIESSQREPRLDPLLSTNIELDGEVHQGPPAMNETLQELSEIGTSNVPTIGRPSMSRS